MSNKIITPLDTGYRPGMMTWSILQRYGIVASNDDQKQQSQQPLQTPLQSQQPQQLDKEKDAPSKQQKEAFRLALEVALGSSVISEEQVSCLWEASHPLRAKDVAKIASQALLQQVSQVSQDAPGVAERFGQVLMMLLAGSSVSSAQIRMMVACTHELTSETIHRVMEEKLREAYQKKEIQKQLKAEEEKRFQDKFREVLQCLDGPTGLSEEAFQVLLAASVTLKAGVAEEIMASVGTSWDDLSRRRTASSAATVTAPLSSMTKFSTGPKRDRAEAMLVRAAAATAEGQHSAAVDIYKEALAILIELLRQETSVLGKSELSNYVDYYLSMAERAKAQASVETDEKEKEQGDRDMSEEKIDLEIEFYDCMEPPAPTVPPARPPKPQHREPPSTSTAPPRATPPPPPPPRTSASTQEAARRVAPPQPPPPPPRRATVALDSSAASDLAASLKSSSPQPPPPPPPRRASIGSANSSSVTSQSSSSLRPRASLDLLSSIQAGSHSLKKVSVTEQQVKKAEEGSSLMGQLSHMIDKRRVYLQDDSDSDSNSDFDD